MNIQEVGLNNLQSFSNVKGKNEVNQTVFDKLWTTIEGMNETQNEGSSKVQDVLLGKSDDTHGALIALEKAELQMQLATTVRDKVTQGYQQIINMQL